MNRVPTRFPLLALAACLALIPACGDETNTTVNESGSMSPPASGTLAVLTDSNAIYYVNPSAPSTLIRGVNITGVVQPTIAFSAIDFRPATRELYALETGSARIYTIDTASGFALSVGAAVIIPTTNPGFDFSPVSDFLRLVDPTDVNFRVNPNISGVTPDTNLNPAANVVALAYSNNFAGATTTTLYGIDSVTAQLVRIGGVDGSPSPNTGVVTPIGPLGVTPGTNDVSFDISPSGTAYAVWLAAAAWRLYTINLATGAATEIGILGKGGRVLGISVVP